jgi:hypothetical protein
MPNFDNAQEGNHSGLQNMPKQSSKIKSKTDKIQPMLIKNKDNIYDTEAKKSNYILIENLTIIKKFSQRPLNKKSQPIKVYIIVALIL